MDTVLNRHGQRWHLRHLGQSGSAKLTFDATGVSWIARRNAYAGIAKVYVDGRKVKTIDLYAKKTQFRKTLYSVSGLSDGTHTIKVVRSGQKNKASRGKNLIFDAFRVLDITPPAVPTGLTTRSVRTGLQVSWQQSPVADLAGFRIYRQTGSAAAALIAKTGPTTTSFRDVGLADDTSYRYTVRAVDTTGNLSAASAALGAATPVAPTYAGLSYPLLPRRDHHRDHVA